jgi:transmembrane sensor
VPSEQIRVKAAAWIAEMHDEQRSADFDARLRAWLGENTEHRRAFVRLTEAWERAGEIRLRARREPAELRTRSHPRISAWTAAVAATLVLAVAATIYFRAANAIATEVGQQRVQWLPDGTHVALNTKTRIEISFDSHARRVRLIRGEARFDVSKHPAWPFLVSVDNHEIRALGTSFIVRLDDVEDLSVTLVEGTISVTPLAWNSEVSAQAPQILTPGQRLIISHHVPILDRPDLLRITAWQHGRVEFEATPLGDAATEMNRYNNSRITVKDADIARLRVGGVFRAGDSDEFVRVVAAAFGLRADRRGGDIVLSRSETPSSPL